ncbi:MAG: glycosyl hydrolase [Candidatus Hydrogenedens sp.]|nr:glycosyl hydrolase [Candidatus Hydrogenedens sp.]
MFVDDTLTAESLVPALERLFALAGPKLRALDGRWRVQDGAPVFTVEGRYTARGWTEWTQGFQYGCQILLFDATEDEDALRRGREHTRLHMAPHVSHTGVHDHGFNNLSTYGNLRRLGLEGRIAMTAEELDFHALAIKVSGAVQAARWTRLADEGGYMYSFNGPQSLFSDTIRSCRVLVAGHAFGHVLMGENDARHSLLGRAIEHLRATARYNVYFGNGRDTYDVWGRVVHESIFNTNDGRYRCPSTQQGYSPFSTWTRGLAWVLLGAAEELECFARLNPEHFDTVGGLEAIEPVLLEMARATADFYLENTCADGIPFWDTGAPGLAHDPDYRDHPSRPDHAHEPVDSSAAAIAAQGLMRLGRYLGSETAMGRRYWQAGLTVMRTLLAAPYLSEDPAHEGLLLHSVYHRPNGWDHVPAGKSVPQGESCLWGDYHLMEAAVMLQRINAGRPYLTYYGCAADQDCWA